MFISFLKIAVGLILIILAIAVLLLLLLLFVPFRYKLNGAYIDEQADGSVNISWLLHFISLELEYHKGVLITGYIKVLGRRIYRIQGKPSGEADEVDPEAAMEESSL